MSDGRWSLSCAISFGVGKTALEHKQKYFVSQNPGAAPARERGASPSRGFAGFRQIRKGKRDFCPMFLQLTFSNLYIFLRNSDPTLSLKPKG